MATADPAPAARAGSVSNSVFDTPLYHRIRTVVLGALVVVAAAVLLMWPAITDYYSYNASYYNGIVASAAISAILTISLNLSMGYGGMLSMMHSGLQLAGGYGTAYVVVKATGSWIIGLAASTAVGALFAVLVLLVSLRATYLYFGMITLAANLIVIEAGREWEAVTGGIVGISGIAPKMGDAPISKQAFYYVVLGFLVLAYIVQRNIVRSGVGRAAMAVRESSDTASAMGISPARAKLLLFGVCGGIAGLSGALYALQLGFINPDVGLLDNGIIFFVGLFLGGISTLIGPVIGVGFIAVLVELIKDQARYTTLVLGVLLLLAMMLIPRGIVGTWKASRAGRDRVPEASDEALPEQVPDVVPEVRDAAPGVPALEGVGLVKHFGGVHAVDGVDIKIMPGTVHGIIGPNGSGKSTLVSCLTRYHRVDAGTVTIFGEEAAHAPHRVAEAGVTRVFQVPHLFERVSVLDNVLTGMRMRESYTWIGATVRSPGYRRQDRAERAEARELLAFAGLASRADWLASSLSHGQKRLLEVVRAVATRPKVLILDEPATGLTSSELDALARLCRVLRERGLAVVLIEHNVDFVMGLCDEITVVESGKVIERGDPERVQSSPAVLEAYLGRPELIEETA
ncbi:branched-chain amino acid ABC transporter permease [Sphaerisporangium siamense]|uniref:Branched-chain amino acid transport system ATP-binding protein/branched-chain amino acid transport system permease protein n=1 Tax=Sphaerisporangium siamense TaxID=795645 RepID=A0A7W7GAX6_9ACTN|nr:branched-chain amino acid ABC transporter ATP-binding protein/permease [Sphaerisporangium siamense]MBB4704498.1 branched-chain amino acid transport system ATP-binding protein/branched-chain amino acid transport system permease protein [Sphaerisporangium siamense]GII86109.1 branched-chain amino acid ABC transporter permease [Sphaerisporangium siamense]